MQFIVCKFGGSSVASSERLEQIVKILKLNQQRRCVVLSAPGKVNENDIKITDLLIEISCKALKNEEYSMLINDFKNKFLSIYKPLKVPVSKIEEILTDLDKRLESPKDNASRFRDLIVAAGEDINSRLFALYLCSIGIKATYINPAESGMIVTSVFGDAQPLPESYMKLASLKKLCSEQIIVFPGFFGYTENYECATFSRGGSDLSGAVLASALDVIEYENWTDVNGIFSAHPKMVDSPIQIPALTYKEMRELSYIGFNVFHEEAVRPVMLKKIPIRLRNTNNIANEGTLIVSERLPIERDVIGVASGGGYCSFTLQKFLMNL